MVFGEIVEPSTRALIDDESEEYPPYVEPNLEWIGDASAPPTVKSLIFVETDRIKKLFKALLLQNAQSVANLKNGSLEIFKVSDESFVITYIENNDLTTGQNVEVLSDWIQKSQRIYGITSCPVASFQDNKKSEDRPEIFIRLLSTSETQNFPFQKLESPNLVTGLGAQVLSYALHKKLEATLFIIYMDSSPLDSVNTSHVIKLMQSLNLKPQSQIVNLNPQQSNLYL